MKKHIRLTILCFAFILCAMAANAQTTAFTYQGKLSDGATAAGGNYDLGFALYDAEIGGTQIGAALTRSNVTVSGGIFTVQLDFGATAFPGASRFLQIAVKKTTETNFTTLTPRQPITSTPYAIRALTATTADTATTATTATNSQQLGGVTATNFVQTDSTAFVRNQTTQQASTNFNVSGNGVVGGKVAIGTNVVPPAASLQVNGGVLARGGAPGANGANGSGYALGGDEDSGMFGTTDGTLQLFVNNNERIRLTRSVDIIAGSGSSGGYDVEAGAGITLQAGNGGGGGVNSGAGAGITLQAGNGGGGGYSGGAGAGITLRAGNGGEGVNAGAGADITIQAGNGANGGNSAGNGASIMLQPGSGGSGYFNGTSGNVILAPTNGNVGIGTTSPTSKMQVNGTLTATSLTATSLTATSLTSTSANINGSLNLNGSLAQDGVMKLCLNALKRVAICLPGLRPADGESSTQIAAQQEKIESLEARIKQQQILTETLEQQITALRKLICAGNPTADGCRQP